MADIGDISGNVGGSDVTDSLLDSSADFGEDVRVTEAPVLLLKGAVWRRREVY